MSTNDLYLKGNGMERMLPGMCADEDDINHEELDCMREAWQDATDRASSAQELWTPSLLQQLSSCFAQIVRVSPDSPGSGKSKMHGDMEQPALPTHSSSVEGLHS